jgi:DNA-binding response OmpR family regulator
MSISVPVNAYDALLVDDEPVLRQAMARAFNRAGFRCELAGDGRHALQLMAERRFHVVITDLRMPEMNGHQLAVELLNQPNRPVVIVVTGITEQKLEVDLRARGIDEIQFKPVDYAHLAARAGALVEERAIKLAQLGSAVDQSATVPSAPEPLPVHDPLVNTAHVDESTQAGNVNVSAASSVHSPEERIVNTAASIAERSSDRTDERILRLECDLANLKVKQNLSKVLLAVICIGGVALGWLLAMMSRWPV